MKKRNPIIITRDELDSMTLSSLLIYSHNQLFYAKCANSLGETSLADIYNDNAEMAVNEISRRNAYIFNTNDEVEQ